MNPSTRLESIPLPATTLRAWQEVVDVLAQMTGFACAFIARRMSGDLEVLRSSRTSGNLFSAGDTMALAGSLSRHVLETTDPVAVSDAGKDDAWAEAPECKKGLTAYLGQSLRWPDGEVFGVLCLLDKKPGTFSEPVKRLLACMAHAVQASLAAALYRSHQETLESVFDGLAEGIIIHDAHRRIEFFNKAAQTITGYRAQDVIGKDCHEVFGQPFCGGRCSFEHGTPEALDRVYYPLNLLTKAGQPRRVEMTVSGRYDAAGRCTGAIAAFRDVTDLTGLKIETGALTGFAGIIGRDASMLRVYRQIKDLGTNDYPVHISGETGTGKELVAAAIHNDSRRGGGPFVPVNCAALPEGVLESELFGHVKGAFTGAIRDKKGRFELAHKGTLFLDEVVDLPKMVQAKLLRVLQEGRFERVGDEKPTSVDVRIISASNRDLKQEVKKGNFRDDLYYRINVVPIHLPPLRERKGDIPLLIKHFLEQARREGHPVGDVSRQALSLLAAYPWPGNVRELQSAVHFALVKSRGRTIEAEHLPLELRQWNPHRPSRGPVPKLNATDVRAALTQTGGNKAKAARILGVGRATLYRFLASSKNVS